MINFNASKVQTECITKLTIELPGPLSLLCNLVHLGESNFIFFHRTHIIIWSQDSSIVVRRWCRHLLSCTMSLDFALILMTGASTHALHAEVILIDAFPSDGFDNLKFL